MTDLENSESKADRMDDSASHSCPHCEKIFKKVYRLTRHIYKEHVKPTCTACSNSFIRMKELKEHALSSHELKMNKLCSICKKAYSSKHDLENHLKKDHIQDRPFICMKCPRMFSDEERLKTHMLIHRKIGLLQCFDCSMTFSSSLKLSRHRRASHADTKTMLCPECGDNFQLDEALSKRICELHTEAEPKIEEKHFACKYCDIDFTIPREMNVHIRMEHADKRPFKCDKCPFIFETEEEVDRHVIRRHTPKKFGCDYCRRRFGQEHVLKRHVLTFHKDRVSENGEANGDVNVGNAEKGEQPERATPVTNGLPVSENEDGGQA